MGACGYVDVTHFLQPCTRGRSSSKQMLHTLGTHTCMRVCVRCVRAVLFEGGRGDGEGVLPHQREHTKHFSVRIAHPQGERSLLSRQAPACPMICLFRCILSRVLSSFFCSSLHSFARDSARYLTFVCLPMINFKKRRVDLVPFLLATTVFAVGKKKKKM